MSPAPVTLADLQTLDSRSKQLVEYALRFPLSAQQGEDAVLYLGAELVASKKRVRELEESNTRLFILAYRKTE